MQNHVYIVDTSASILMLHKMLPSVIESMKCRMQGLVQKSGGHIEYSLCIPQKSNSTDRKRKNKKIKGRRIESPFLFLTIWRSIRIKHICEKINYFLFIYLLTVAFYSTQKFYRSVKLKIEVKSAAFYPIGNFWN